MTRQEAREAQAKREAKAKKKVIENVRIWTVGDVGPEFLAQGVDIPPASASMLAKHLGTPGKYNIHGFQLAGRDIATGRLTIRIDISPGNTCVVTISDWKQLPGGSSANLAVCLYRMGERGVGVLTPERQNSEVSIPSLLNELGLACYSTLIEGVSRTLILPGAGRDSWVLCLKDQRPIDPKELSTIKKRIFSSSKAPRCIAATGIRAGLLPLVGDLLAASPEKTLTVLVLNSSLLDLRSLDAKTRRDVRVVALRSSVFALNHDEARTLLGRTDRRVLTTEQEQEKELRAILKWLELQEGEPAVRKQRQPLAIMVTRAEHGASLLYRWGDRYEFTHQKAVVVDTDRIRDTTGCGDSVLGILVWAILHDNQGLNPFTRGLQGGLYNAACNLTEVGGYAGMAGLNAILSDLARVR